MSTIKEMFGGKPAFTPDQIAIAQALAQFNLSMVGTEKGEKSTGENSSWPIRNTVGNAYVEFVKAEAQRVVEAIKELDPAESSEHQRQATIKLIAQTSLICGAMLNFAVSGFVANKEARDDILAKCFKDIRTRIDESQTGLDTVRQLSAIERTPNAQ